MTHPHHRTILALICLAAAVVFVQPGSALAASAVEIDAKVNAALERFYEEVDAAEELAGKAEGMLVFPSVIKAGFGIGGEYGEGALRVGDLTVDYYNTVAASIGFQIGAQAKTVILLFMTKKALKGFRKSDGWEAGVDGSVALADLGAGGELTTDTLRSPIIGFIFDNKGLMYNLTLEGAKMTRIDKD